ncbi:MAG: hypothetical protein J2P15_00810 [Micromonosporaceae bacterium]|nr:hypothetical protein [Micromonosporaceae bacterium]
MLRPTADKVAKFAVLKRDVRAKGQHVASSHPSAGTESGAAQAAAKPPADDTVAQGKAANAEKMNDAKPKAFDKAAFVKAVQQAIAQQAPKNLDEADKFADSDKPEQVKKDVQGRVAQGKDASAHDIATTTAAPPDTSKAVEKKVVPLAPDRPPGTPATPDPGNAVPDKLPPSATDLSGGPRQVNQEMATAQVTEPQLAKSNEPTFNAALKQKHTAEQDSARGTPAMRAHESATLKGATTDAQHQGAAGMHVLAAARVTAGQKVGAGKQGAKGRDETRRAQVTAALQKVFDATKKDVEDILCGLDKKVDDQFTREEKAARDAFTAEHKQRMDAYKDKRYSGWSGKWRWVRDKFLGLPEEANQIFVVARDHYIARMQAVISDVADTIGRELDRAKARIAKGRDDLKAAVAKLPADLKAIGAQAADEFAGRFDELNEQVDQKGTDLVQTLATKYNDALKSVDDEIAAEKEKNKGLVAKAVDAVKGVIKTILELKNLLLGVLKKAASAVMLILNDPIGFLRNLVSAVGAGLKQFLKNIVHHLEQGLMTWLLGVTAQAGLTLPTSFDVKGILLMIAGLLGLTWQFVRSRIVRKIPERVVAAVETGVTLLMRIRKEGIAGLWDEIKERIGDLKHNLISKVTEFLIPTIIVAGIMWVLSLLNPASAFVRAVKLIIDIVQFIVERGRQVIDFVNAVLDAVIAIAKGGTGGVPGLIENALARSIPVLIGFLAALLGVGGIAGRIRKIFDAMSKPVAKAIDWVVDKIVGLVKKLWAKLKKVFDRAKKRFTDWRRRRKEQRDRKRRRDGKDDRSPAEQRKDLDAAVRDATRLIEQENATAKTVRKGLPAIKKRYDLTSIRLVEESADHYYVVAAINPEERTKTEPLSEDRFWYKMTEVSPPIKTISVPPPYSNLHQVHVPMQGNDPVTGFVINITAIPGDVHPDTASRYLGKAWSGSGGQNLAAARTAVVIGVNTFQRLDPAADMKGRSNVREGVAALEKPSQLLLAAFSFLWEPRWVNTKKGNQQVHIDEVRKAYKDLSGTEREAAIAANEKGLSGKIPFGVLREEVFLAKSTQRAVEILGRVNQQVYVLVTDADTGVTAPDQRGILAVYDEVLRDAASDPLLVIGGYRFEGFDWGARARSRERQLTELANNLDRAIKTAIGKAYPEVLYPAEPNLLMKVWERSTSRELKLVFQNTRLLARLRSRQGTVFGVGAGEGRSLGNWMKATYGLSVSHRPEASAATDPRPDDQSRGLTVYESQVLSYATGQTTRREQPDLAPDPMSAVIFQSQSMASAARVATEFVRGVPANERLRNDLFKNIFIHAEEVARLMSEDPRLTTGSAPVVAHFQALDRAVRDTLQAALAQAAPGDRKATTRAVNMAGHLTRRIIAALTGEELKGLWNELSPLLKEIVNDRPTPGAPP